MAMTLDVECSVLDADEPTINFQFAR